MGQIYSDSHGERGSKRLAHHSGILRGSRGAAAVRPGV